MGPMAVSRVGLRPIAAGALVPARAAAIFLAGNRPVPRRCGGTLTTAPTEGSLRMALALRRNCAHALHVVFNGAKSLEKLAERG